MQFNIKLGIISLFTLFVFFSTFRHTKTEATTDELSKEFKEKIMEVVSTYMEAGERERFADETECFLALRLNVEAFDTAYQRYQSQQDHGDDDDDSEIRQWTLREMKSLKLNNRVVMKKCIESGTRLVNNFLNQILLVEL